MDTLMIKQLHVFSGYTAIEIPNLNMYHIPVHVHVHAHTTIVMYKFQQFCSKLWKTNASSVNRTSIKHFLL